MDKKKLEIRKAIEEFSADMQKIKAHVKEAESALNESLARYMED
ncbi:MAG TPA: hypothetical protein VIH03_06205 [Nitrososphaerales archaeon]